MRKIAALSIGVWLGAVGVVDAKKASLGPIDFGGQIRARGETTNVGGYATPGVRAGNDFMLLRVRLHAEAKPAKGVVAFVEIQDSRTAGSEASVAADSKNLDLHRGYFEVQDLWELPVSVKVGRMSLKYGDQRLISPLDWSNVGRAWDGVRLRAKGDHWTADLFTTVVVEKANNRSDNYFSGLYASWRGIDNHEVDAYLLARDFGDGTQTSEHGLTNGNLTDRTIGTRLKGKTGAVDYSGEAAWQFGRKAGQRVRAWAMAATAGYSLDTTWSPRFAVGYDFASGDANPNDAQVQTFDPLFTFGHFYQGHQDLYAWKNGHAFKASLSAKPAEGWKAQIDAHHFMLAHTRDSWYSAGGATIARDTTGSSGKNVGNEVDIHFKTSVRKVIKLWFGYSRFFAGSFVKKVTYYSKDRDWAFFQAALNF